MRSATRLALTALLAFASVACGPPKVLVGHVYASDDKSINTFIQKSGASVGSNDDKTDLFNVYMRVCNQDANNSTNACKDSLILSNVNPKSL